MNSFDLWEAIHLHTRGNLCESPGSSLFSIFMAICSIVKRMRPFYQKNRDLSNNIKYELFRCNSD